MKLDKRRKYYAILDTETATLPFVREYEPADRKKISIAKPLVYDLGYKIIDRNGNEYLRRSFLITEIFSVPSIFQTAYYAEKRPLYIQALKNGDIILTDWNAAIETLIDDLQEVDAVGAYNAMFDFKKAITFTERYINALYSEDYDKWEQRQRASANTIIQGQVTPSNLDLSVFRIRDFEKPIFDLWGLACDNLLNNDNFRDFCDELSLYTQSKQYYSTTAETAYKFITNNVNFQEAHTAINDADIEADIFTAIIRKTGHNFQRGITPFPFRKVGKVLQ